MEIKLTTYKDVIDHLIDFAGANVSEEARRDGRRGALTALREFTSAHRWTYYYQRGRLTTYAPQSTGTVTYTNSTRTLTLAGGTWPDWAAYGVVAIAGIEYLASARNSDTDLVLAESSNPGVDLAAGTSYQIWMDTYPLPGDFLAMDQLVEMTLFRNLEYLRPGEWLSWHAPGRGPSPPYAYTTTSAPQYFGSLALRLFPAPDRIYQLDYVYQRRPRPLLIEQVSTGTVSVTSGAASVTGVGTTFTSRLVGSSIRFSGDALNLPTSAVGSNPAALERVITAVGSATSLTLDAVASDTLAGVKYLISDPVDIEEGAMLTGYLRCAEVEMARARQMKQRVEIDAAYRAALIHAMEADARNFDLRVAGQRRRRWLRLAEMPRGPDS